MKIGYTNHIPQSNGPRIHLKPETGRDRKMCERMLADGVTCGFGRDPDSGEIIHVQVEVKSID